MNPVPVVKFKPAKCVHGEAARHVFHRFGRELVCDGPAKPAGWLESNQSLRAQLVSARELAETTRAALREVATERDQLRLNLERAVAELKDLARRVAPGVL